MVQEPCPHGEGNNMKLETYEGLGTKVVLTVTPNESASLVSTIVNQLLNRNSPHTHEVMTRMENGINFCVKINFNKE